MQALILSGQGARTLRTVTQSTNSDEYEGGSLESVIHSVHVQTATGILKVAKSASDTGRLPDGTTPSGTVLSRSLALSGGVSGRAARSMIVWSGVRGEEIANGPGDRIGEECEVRGKDVTDNPGEINGEESDSAGEGMGDDRSSIGESAGVGISESDSGDRAVLPVLRFSRTVRSKANRSGLSCLSRGSSVITGESAGVGIRLSSLGSICEMSSRETDRRLLTIGEFPGVGIGLSLSGSLSEISGRDTGRTSGVIARMYRVCSILAKMFFTMDWISLQ